MSYTRAQDVQIDVWEALGNTGWNWDSLFPYYKKSEYFQIPTEDQVSHGADYYINYHGRNGPLKTGWPSGMSDSSILPVLDETLSQLGLPYNRDVNGGQMVGLTAHPNTIDQVANIREDAARAYYWPYEERPNLKVISNTYANKIIWGNSSDDGDAVAVGVEVNGPNGTEIIYATKEVILSAGSLKSPMILELSGIGNPVILDKYNIPVKVNLSSVGENLQDQTNNEFSYAGKSMWKGSPTFSALPSADQIYGNHGTEIASAVNASLADYAKAVSDASNGAVQAANVLTALQVQYNLIFKSKVPFAEIVFLPLGPAFSAEYWPLLPFSRGSIHIKSADPTQAASINPNYFMFDFDLHAQIDVAQYIRKAFNTAPLSGLVGEEYTPGLEMVPKNATDSAWENWVKTRCELNIPRAVIQTLDTCSIRLISADRSNFHPVGTASMLPREKGGVVSPELKVYGTKNVRVVDASVVPFQLCGHLTSTLYAMAEKAADIIQQ